MTRFVPSALSVVTVLTAVLGLVLTPPVAWAFVSASPSRPFSGWGQSVVFSKTKHNHLATPKATSSSPATDATILPSTTAPEAITPDNWALLSERGRAALLNLMKHDATRQAQTHVYGNWPDAGTDDDGKQRLAEQVCVLLCVALGGNVHESGYCNGLLLFMLLRLVLGS